MSIAEGLRIDAPMTADQIASAVRLQIKQKLRRRGAVVGVSGGVDSAVVAAICARALGRENVLALLMPERGESGESLRLGRLVAEKLGLVFVVEEIGPTLRAIGCYARQAEAIRTAFPDFRPGWPFKITLPPLLDGERLNVPRLTVELPSGEQRTSRLSAEAYRLLVAATNFKQRVRKTLEYHWADRMQYAVAGTPNRLEWDQGFFVKQGDGDADVKPIAHLYKTQVYALAAELGVPAEVQRRPPTTDTFSLPQTQEEFYFALPWPQMDGCLWAMEHGLPPARAAQELGLTGDEVERVFKDLQAKRRATIWQHEPPLTVEPLGAGAV